MATVSKIVFGPDEHLAAEILRAVEEAKESVRVCMFWFDYKPLANALIRASRRGVQVQVLVDARSFREMVDEHGSAHSRYSVPMYLVENNIAVFAYEAHGHILHHKFLLVDSGEPGSTTLISTCNWHYADLVGNRDTLLVIQDRDLARRLNGWFTAETSRLSRLTKAQARKETLRTELRTEAKKVRRRFLRSLRGLRTKSEGAESAPSMVSPRHSSTCVPFPRAVERLECPLESHFSDESSSLADVITMHLMEASHEVLIMHSIIRWEGLADVLAPLVSRGVRVRVIGNSFSGDCLGVLQQAGVDSLRFRSWSPYSKMHHKVIIIDRRVVLWGTVNLFPRSLHKDRELLLVFGSSDFAAPFIAEFESLWGQHVVCESER